MSILHRLFGRFRIWDFRQDQYLKGKYEKEFAGKYFSKLYKVWLHESIWHDLFGAEEVGFVHRYSKTFFYVTGRKNVYFFYLKESEDGAYNLPSKWHFQYIKQERDGNTSCGG